ncbi:MFS transporter [Bradyrhizobium sp. Ash2021]|uniref:MFS transporter n=1 Tax=Bradyrhizobium sp. Ash2021 TaxID=2954771 RepID=UPI00281500B9|nr:MFS transporter [Bradyrhizobium sp. Ash2021]WMT76398.1 MFS transporter [Bradyrhizobium sp. Ash2021]
MSDAQHEKQIETSSAPSNRGSLLSPFRYAAFSVLWTSTVASNIGTWMQNAAAGWLMTSLDPNPAVVALVQVASSLPMMIFALPAGTLADIVDRRKLLLVVQMLATALIAILGYMIWLEWVTPAILLGFTFLVSTTAILATPAWQSIVPQLVPLRELAQAVALNSIGFNISRAIGPALAGLAIAAWGLVAPFWLNAVSNIGVIAALLWWRSSDKARDLPPERFGGAMRAGLRHARYNPHLRATIVRSVGFFPFASAYWALLPLVARDQLAGGPQLYGILLGAIGVGAVGGAFVLPLLKTWLGADLLAVGGAIGTTVALVLFGVARQPAIALTACLIAGLSWIAVLAMINVSAQISLPEWVRGRGLAIFVTFQFGGFTLGSIIWGWLAHIAGLPMTHFIAATAGILAIPLLWRWKLQTAAGVDLTPSMHWPTPVLSQSIEPDRGPVMVTVEYDVMPIDREAFLRAIAKLERERRRDGAFEWGVFEDAAVEGRFVETFLVDSWTEHMRQHERVTNADRVLQDEVHRFHRDYVPKVTHLIAVEHGSVTPSPLPERQPGFRSEQ